MKMVEKMKKGKTGTLWNRLNNQLKSVRLVASSLGAR